ncbi:MAG: DinB family protein [Anaerolineales bacterium]|uniref:DinB family protein n=1 Tax=Candidatus Villigracilis vicinus TaxID=3140679 RepID=UPI003134782E|nr:DinB family protein [Anaerolineales bacterium]
MKLTLLLDLDETLLNTNQDIFFPAYLQALSTNFASFLDPKLVMRALLSSIEKMNQNQDATRSLKDVFSDEFCPMVGMSREALDTHIDDFYSRVFPSLRGITSQIPEVQPFVDWAVAQGYRLVVATDPLLPRPATRQRVQWAGLEPEQFELISTFEDFHFLKNYPAYYAEVLGRIGWQDGPVLMVGNDMERDIMSARKLGLATFFIETESGSTSGSEAGPRGTLADLRRYLETTDLASLTPSLKAKDAIMTVFSSTPAVLDGLLRNLSTDDWKRKLSASEWTLTELICHLRDTEREVHLMQLKLFSDKDEPFIPRPDTSVWASQRDYLHEDGPTALREFNDARLATLEILYSTPAEGWGRKARHAIFGPTDFREVAGFMADHDRMHIHQAWALLKKM